MILLLLVWGLMGVGLGIPNLIWDENPFNRFASARSATLLLALLGVNAYYLGINPTEADHNDTINSMKEFMREFGLNLPFGSWLEPDPHGRRPYEANRRNLSLFLRLARLPFLMLISLPALFPRPFDFVPGNAPSVLSQAAEINFAKGSVRHSWEAYLFGLLVWRSGFSAGFYSSNCCYVLVPS